MNIVIILHCLITFVFFFVFLSTITTSRTIPINYFHLLSGLPGEDFWSKSFMNQVARSDVRLNGGRNVEFGQGADDNLFTFCERRCGMFNVHS